MRPTSARTAGCLLGLALGDAMGAPHEGGPIDGLLGPTSGEATDGLLRWTDDTAMALGLAESLATCGGLDQDHLARVWASDYAPDRGYGAGAATMLEAVRDGADWRAANRAVFPDGSFGNGAAMRAAPLGLFYADDASARRDAATKAAEITHAHPLGIEGGLFIAEAAAAALDEPPLDVERFVERVRAVCSHLEFTDRLDHARHLLKAPDPPTPSQIADELGHNILAHQSAVTAVYLFLRHRDDPLTELIEQTVRVGGDVDTIGAMAAGLWGAYRGLDALPDDLLNRLEARQDMEVKARRLAEAAS